MPARPYRTAAMSTHGCRVAIVPNRKRRGNATLAQDRQRMTHMRRVIVVERDGESGTTRRTAPQQRVERVSHR
jgi:hypothetical protein